MKMLICEHDPLFERLPLFMEIIWGDLGGCMKLWGS